jgi:hypothetical protein
MIFGKAANPKIDGIDISIKLEQLRLQIGIARNLTEIRDAGQPKCDARAVIIRKPMVAAALNIEGGKIKTAGARGPK